MKRFKNVLNSLGFSHVEAFLVVIVMVVIGGIALHEISGAAAYYTPLDPIDYGGQLFYGEACIERVHTNSDDILAQMSVDRPAGVKASPSYNPVIGYRVESSPPVDTYNLDDWRTGNTSMISYSFNVPKGIKFRLTVTGSVDGMNRTDYTPPYVYKSLNECNTAASSSANTAESVGWPFATKSSSQFRRVDQGWDLQSSSGAAIYAIDPGYLYQFNADPGGFGDNYPVERLDNSIGGPTNWVYYGHVHVIASLINSTHPVHVNQGQVIAYANTYEGENGSGAPQGWIEIGFSQPGNGAPIAKLEPGDHLEGAATRAGLVMCDILENQSTCQNVLETLN